MRGGCVIVLLLLAGCSREPDFDQRYDKAQQDLQAKAAKIDQELAERKAAASQTSPDAAASGASPSR